MIASRTCLRRETTRVDARMLGTVVNIQRVEPMNSCSDEAMAVAKLPCCSCGWVHAAPISLDGHACIARRGTKLPACEALVRILSMRLAIDVWRPGYLYPSGFPTDG